MEDLESEVEQKQRGKLQYSLEYNFRIQEVGMLMAMAQQGKAMLLHGHSLLPTEVDVPSPSCLQPASSHACMV